ncbi:putative sister chromatid cohesion protein Pds5 [Helianthus annuus]|nr:putative sister chromatid cohesion protein Pds5 [Helianthus annuus]
MLTNFHEDGKPNNSLKKEEVISVLSILQSIRSSEDAIDTNMSKNSYAICDLCFLITKRLAQKQEDLEEPLVHVRVPQGLYVSHDKKEENETEKDKEEEKESENDKKEQEKEDKKHVTKGHTWLGEASAVAHFESLNMESNESVCYFHIMTIYK